MRVPPYERELAAALAQESAGAPLSASMIAAKAHRRWDLDQFENAAALFCLAAERARESAADPDPSPNYIVRAGITLNRAGRTAEAEVILWEAACFDWIAAGLSNDTNMIEWAFSELLHNAYRDAPESFSSLFVRAIDQCAKSGIEYPRIHPQQEALLRESLDLHEWEAAHRIVSLISSRRPISRPARALLQEAQTRLAERQRDDPSP